MLNCRGLLALLDENDLGLIELHNNLVSAFPWLYGPWTEGQGVSESRGASIEAFQLRIALDLWKQCQSRAMDLRRHPFC